MTPFFKINGQVVYDRSFITKCVVVSPSLQSNGPGIGINEIYKKFSAHPQPYIVSKVDNILMKERPYPGMLADCGIKSFMACPIFIREELSGVFEVGSVDEEGISYKTLDVLQLALPIVRDLVYFMIKSFDDRINQVIKDKFTSLQRIG